MEKDLESPAVEPWTLRFDGACRRNPGPGGAIAALFDPSGAVVWTCSHFLPCRNETNNTAEFTAFLVEVRGALHHGAMRLKVKRDSHLVISQVRGSFGCGNGNLRRLRNRVKSSELRSLDCYCLQHIDCNTNGHADRLAKKTRHRLQAHSHYSTSPSTSHPPALNASVIGSKGSVDEALVDIEADIAARDDGEVFPTPHIGPGSDPEKQPRLRLRKLDDEEHDAAAAALQAFVERMASNIIDADNSRNSAPSRQRPPRVTRNQREHRLDEALNNLAEVQRSTPGDRRAVRKARRRAGRVQASTETAVEDHPETCPIGREELHRHFTGTSTAPAVIDYTSASGQEFRAALDSFQPADVAPDAFTGELQVDEVEDQLSRATKISSPGHDGIGYDVYRRFAEQLVLLLHAAFQFCWLHRRVPALWKVGFVRLIHKKGDPMQSTNWRPICLLPLSTSCIVGCWHFVSHAGSRTRRQHRRLYQVWYDLRNAFGSLPQELMWRVLRHLGVEADFVARCQDIYCGSAPLLFIAALVPLVRRLEQLDGAGVPLAEDVRPCVTAYADDLKVFSDSADGIRRCHGVVTRFLAWTGLRANPAKSASLVVKRDARGNAIRDEDVRLEVQGDAIAPLSLQESYTYLGVGDGFDHVHHRLQLAPKLQQVKREAVEYALRHLRPLQSQLQGFDRAVSKGLRHLLRLPQSATTEFFYTPTSGGGLGLQSLVEMHQALQLAHAWQMLHSKDPSVAAVALAPVCQSASKRYRLQEEHWRGRILELCRLLLNSQLAASPYAEVLRRKSDIGSL
ncbi:unnamed protein product [Peronospora farinosa]|uniref:Reverse transcriptase domain-containing protein n=1 Tax=Peronospora farinosa TaxID=134698 RepID=A0AAV0SW72_9STRA|nr:unnamed protein product [Peronospora farinosa]